MKRKRLRSARGAGLVFGILVVASIVGASVVAILVLLNVGFCAIYDEKLARVGTYAALYAAAHAQDGSGEDEVKAYTEKLMLAMGLTPEKVSINISKINTDYGPSVQVTVANKFGLLDSYGLLPTQITLQDTVAAPTGQND